MRLQIKPLSVNDAWKGRRYRTEEYKHYQKLLGLMLKFQKVPIGKLKLTVVFGFSSAGSDIDNCLKPLIDCLQKKYLFNDNRIYRLEVDKVDVKKGEEFIEFEIHPYRASFELLTETQLGEFYQMAERGISDNKIAKHFSISLCSVQRKSAAYWENKMKQK